MENPLVPVGNQTERSFLLEIFRKKVLPSEVFLFSRFLSEYHCTKLRHHTSTMLFDEMRGFCFWKNCTVAFD